MNPEHVTIFFVKFSYQKQAPERGVKREKERGADALQQGQNGRIQGKKTTSTGIDLLRFPNSWEKRGLGGPGSEPGGFTLMGGGALGRIIDRGKKGGKWYAGQHSGPIQGEEKR